MKIATDLLKMTKQREMHATASILSEVSVLETENLANDNRHLPRNFPEQAVHPDCQRARSKRTVFLWQLSRKRYSVPDGMVRQRIHMAVGFQKSMAPKAAAIVKRAFVTAMLVFAMAFHWRAAGQTSPSASPKLPSQPDSLSGPSSSIAPNADPAPLIPSSRLLFDFKDFDIKFHLQTLMNILRDPKHEGWVLAPYPDPKTSRPLIGAGFGLDVVATEHLQRDTLNPHPFIEPSSAQLWQAAGLDAERLQQILDQFDRDLEAWTKKKYRRKIRTHALRPVITEEEATRLLRISSIQAVQNARAYCRGFDQLTASQQMALSQLVFQMGVNLEEFVQFLGAINGESNESASLQPNTSNISMETENDHWQTVQRTLIESEWARR
jgi:hypothetical protein